MHTAENPLSQFRRRRTTPSRRTVAAAHLASSWGRLGGTAKLRLRAASHSTGNQLGAAVFLSVHDLFSETEDVDLAKTDPAAPLATRMRPRSLDEFVGHEHILAPGKLLRRAIEADRLPSVILSGPPGTGKT